MMHLFEASWEVCNKVGGIHTVIRTKVQHALKEFGDNYFLLGPLFEENPEFRETNEECFEKIRGPIEEKGLQCKFGRWNIDGEPKTILVGYHDHYDINRLLYSYWRDFGVDSYAGRWDYMEPILFSTACGEVIATLHDTLVGKEDKAVAHFHEWLMGGGILHLKKHLPDIGLVFTTHATTLGRCMSSLGRDIHKNLSGINAIEEAKVYGIAAKHYMESIAAREADCFTTISQVSADEASALLGKTPDMIIHNGCNIAEISNPLENATEALKHRGFLRELAQNFLQKELPPETLFWITSGRYEFHNKGYDILLEALAKLNNKIKDDENARPVVALLLLAAGHRGVQEGVHRRLHGEQGWDQVASSGITTHHLDDEQNDPILKTCQHLQLRNTADSKVNIIFSPAYLDGHDGIFNTPYENILSACDLGVFPSFYEPWGYTPLESIAHAVPTITTDLAGFGVWASNFVSKDDGCISIVPRKGQERDAVIDDLARLFYRYLSLSQDENEKIRHEATQLATNADWGKFYDSYLSAYDKAIQKASNRFDVPDTSSFKCWHHSHTPRYRSFTVVTTTPKKIEGLYDIAHNLWWSWNPDARDLFAEIDQDLWVSSRCNPVQLLNQIPSDLLQQKSEDPDFLERYEKVYSSFQNYMTDSSFSLESTKAMGPKNPICYFSMEYGLHECLPIYSGGLGVLSGDHLKSASDLNLPLIGIGLFYREGYFTQHIDSDGNQTESYPMLDCSMLPVKSLRDENGEEARVSVQLPGRMLHAKVWIVQVGRIKLYLLDSDVEENEPDDRWLTARLYGGDRRTRLKQELVVALGGVRLITDVLKLQPCAYHMNEGHCAFLTLERIRNLVKQQGLSFQEAREAVRASSVFTTHTPVPAGNEVFSIEILEHYMRDYVCHDMGMPWEQFLELGRESAHDHGHHFSMTVLALKLSSKANGVAKLHGKVSRDMWKNVWKDLNVEEIPIFPITNGIHTQTFLSKNMRGLFDEHLDVRWGKNEDEPEAWKKVDKIPDEQLWTVKQAQKERFIELIKSKIARDYARRGESPQLIRDTVRGLSSDVLTIGFARRFATYKRANLFLRDFERIKRIISNHERPVQIIIAGKAHPADNVGKDVIKSIVHASRTEEFKGRVIYLENYDMGIGRLLTRGVDIWLNNPIRPNEASGTSGMKLCPNGGLNFSILDGWWDEAYSPDVGWKIGSRTEYMNREHQDEIDNLALLDTLEHQVIPLYYANNELGYSPGWVAMMKSSIAKLSPQFSTMRMLKEYYYSSYLPTAKREQLLKANDYQDIKALTAWKQMISSRFPSVQIARLEVRGIGSDVLMEAGGELEVTMDVHPGKLEPSEIQAEFVIGLREGDNFAEKPEIIQFEQGESVSGEETLRFNLTHKIFQSGNYSYAVRIVPVHKLLASPQETGLICWG